MAAAFALFIAGRPPTGGPAIGARAPLFTLPTTSGSQVSLADQRGRDVLLYFSEGVGCDPCFYQMVELERNADQLQAAGLTVLPIVTNPADQVAGELQRFGIRTPFLLDEDKRVSSAYGVLGKGMHADLPGHTFILVDGTGRVRWEQEYPSMYVSTSDLLSALQPFLS